MLGNRSEKQLMKRFLKQLPVLKQLLGSRTDIMITRATAARQLRLELGDMQGISGN